LLVCDEKHNIFYNQNSEMKNNKNFRFQISDFRFGTMLMLFVLCFLLLHTLCFKGVQAQEVSVRTLTISTVFQTVKASLGTKGIVVTNSTGADVSMGFNILNYLYKDTTRVLLLPTGKSIFENFTIDSLWLAGSGSGSVRIEFIYGDAKIQKMGNDGGSGAQTDVINYWTASQRFLDSVYARTKAVWGSGYKRAMTLYGVAPSLVWWDSVNNKAAGFAFDNGEMRGYIGSSLGSVGTNWMKITTGQLSFINNAIVLGGSSYTGGGSSIQFVYDAYPNTNGSQSLGSKDLTWAEVYVNGFTSKMDSTGSDVTMDFSTNTILVTTGATDKTITLKNASSYKDGREVRVKKVDDGAGKVIVVTENTGYIDGASADNILSMNECKTYKKKGNNYYIIY
jgi:hypothetical protein